MAAGTLDRVADVDSNMKRLWRAAEFLAWTAFFLFAALVLVLRFWILPEIERYREHIVAAVSEAVGQPIRIGRIEAGWLGLNPQLALQDVQVFDAQGREALVLPMLENVISWKSVFTGKLHLHSLVIDGPRLAVRRDASGAVYVAGIKLGGAPGERSAGDWVLAQDEIEIRNAEIEWFDDRRGAPPLALSALNLRLRNSGQEHSIGLSARPPAELGSTLELRAEISGHPVSAHDPWNGRVYIELGYTELAGWRPWVDYPLDVRKGEGALRLWATLQNGDITRATADVALSGVAARLGKELPLVELSALTGRLQASVRENGYDIAGRQLALAAASGSRIDPTDFELSWTPAGKEPEKGSFAARRLDLAPLAHLAEALPLPALLRQRLAELAPAGRLTDAKVDWQGDIAEPAKVSGKARFADLALRPWGRLPGFSGLSGTLDASEAKGSLQLASRNAALELPQVLAVPRVAFDTLEGSVHWERTGAQGADIRIGSLAFANADLEGKASGSYAWPATGRGAIDLEAALKRGDGARVAQYLPSADLMGKEVYDYLARAIVGGKASDVHLRLKGDLRDFPFTDPAKGQFRVAARVEKGVLDYVPGWPRIHDIDAELLFERDRMEIVSRSASVLGARLANVRVTIPSLLSPRVVLAVNGQADGPAAGFLEFVQVSPVQRMIGGFTDAMRADGRGKLRLKLELPLKDLDSTSVAGDFELAANTLTVHASLPPIERASGRFSFTESTLAFQDFKGRFLGGAITASGGSKAGTGIEVRAQGDATVAATQAIFDHPWRRYLSGAAPYSATVAVREGRARISFESSLRGVASALPPPFSKSAAESLPLRIEVIPAEGGARERISIVVARIAAAEVLRRRQGEEMVVQRAGISLSPAGVEPVRLPERPGTLVYGALAELDLDRWLALGAGDAHKPLAGGTATEPAMPGSYELKLGRLDAFGKRIHQLELRAGSDASGWSAAVKADGMAGEVSYRYAEGGRLVARMTDFTIPADYPGAKPGDGASRTRELPSVDLVAERFTYKDKQLGRIEVVAQRAQDDWRIDRLALVNPEASVSGKGLWRTAPSSSTSLALELESSDGGQFLARLGYPGLVRGARSKMQASLRWSGDPVAIDYPSLSGTVQLQSQDGQFLEIEPGLGKLVSLMSLQMLPKRLTLDFRDVFSKGFQFDRIAAAGDIERGVMKLRDFNMRGSAADVEMTGEVDLARETQNLQVRVVPQLGDTASTVLALINPLLLFPAAIAQRILKDPLGHIFAFNYTITGSWTDPKVAKRGVQAEPVKE